MKTLKQKKPKKIMTTNIQQTTEKLCKSGNHPIEMRQCSLTVYEGERWEWTREGNRTKIFYHCWNTKCHKQAKKQSKDYYQEITKGLEIEVITQRNK